MTSSDPNSEIESLKKIALSPASNKETTKKAMDTLASFRKDALPALTEISRRIYSRELANYALDKIKEINEAKF